MFHWNRSSKIVFQQSGLKVTLKLRVCCMTRPAFFPGASDQISAKAAARTAAVRGLAPHLGTKKVTMVFFEHYLLSSFWTFI